MRLKQTVTLLRGTIQEFGDDDCSHVAAAVSAFVLVSAFALALALVSFLGFEMDSWEGGQAVIEAFGGVATREGDSGWNLSSPRGYQST